METERKIVSWAWFGASFVVVLAHVIPDLDPGLVYGIRAPDKEYFSWIPVVSKIRISGRGGWTSMYVVGMVCSAIALANSLSTLPLALLLLVCQTCRRFQECRSVHRFGNRQFNIVLVLISWTFYACVALTLLLDSGQELAVVRPYNLKFARASIGTAFFMYCSYLQRYCHHALAAARPLRGKYGIVRGGIFELVCCPHYTAEIGIYLSFLILSPGLPTAGLFCFVFVNLTRSAILTDEWYRKTFSASMLPPGRRTIVPYFL
jgi:3-oxo-5-alpha-steroid 4-dehydrogenase